MIIEIDTIGKIPAKLPIDLVPTLAKVFSPLVDGCLIGPPLEMPPAAYNASRKQYLADLILDRLRYRITGENKLLALIENDLYTHGLNFVFGQAQCPGRVALVSLRRLDQTFYGMTANYNLFLKRATKEAVHELGHTFGLRHCSNLDCVMSFSNSLLDVDRKSPTFCDACRKKLFTF